MTGDNEECSVVEISQLEKSLSSDANLFAAQPITTAFLTSNMTIQDHCMYTTAISSELAGNFPEGTVLQIMPDSTVVALSVKNLPLSNENSIIFKDPSTLVENTQNTLNLTNLLTEHNEQQNVDNPVCSVENISDIDLSFLNDTEENTAIADSKCLNDNSVKELQGIIADVSPQSLNLLQNDLHLPDNNAKAIPEPEPVASEPPQQSNNDPNNVVMIDVSKPIQLSQNSLIMVNGQKCVLQHDSQSGQVIAYPVKEQEKPRKKRGRPRKTLLEQDGKEAVQNESVLSREAENLSEEEREKGLLEIVNDDGALVRRSSRKRKKAKVLKDYETGNLKQELGSDLEDMDVVEKDTEISSHKKKARGPGRPRKYNKAVETILDSSANNGTKRPRGRPRKIAPETEPTQAFLVQTADGQVLMMQVPLSSIPPGISLQEMAQEIANKLNIGLNKETSSKELSSKCDEQVHVNPSESVETVSEPALQDHSVGSTTNFSNIPPELNSANENSNIVDSTCQDIMNDMNQIIRNHIATTGEVMLESNNSAMNSNVAENLPKDKNQINVLEVPQCSEDNFCFNIASTTTPNDSSSILCNLSDALTDHDFFRLKPNIPDPIKEISVPIQASKTCEVPKDFLTKCDVLKEKIDYPVALNTDTLIDPESQTINIEELFNKNLNSDSPEGFILNIDKLKGYSVPYDSGLSDNKSVPVEKQYIIQEMPNIDCPDPISRNVVKSVDIEAKADVNSTYLQSESIIENVQCTDVITGEYLNSEDCEEVKSLGQTTVQFLKSDEPQPGTENFEIVLPLQQSSLSLESCVQNSNVAVNNNSSSTTVIPVPEKVLPMLVPEQSASGPKKCKICQRPCSTHEELIEHFRVNHPKCICTECNYMNEHPYVIRRHAFRHTNHGCVCKICNKKYKDLYILKMHIKMVHLPPDVLYACEICEKKFTRKAHLKRHLRIHAPVKQYQCPHCDYKGCEKSDITKHLLIHEEPRYKCEVCGKAFRHIKNRDLHLKRHSGQRDYKCAACGFFGYTYTDIRKHIERRHSVSCPECKQVFTDFELWKEHKSAGSCQANPLKEDQDIKIEEGPSITIDNKDQDLLDGVPLDILETDQPQVMTISECTEETLSALQNGQLIMTSVDGIFNPENGQLVVEDSIINSDTLSVVAIEGDSTKTITFITPDGKNVSIPLKDCRTVEPSECATTASETNITESFLLTNESETVS